MKDSGSRGRPGAAAGAAGSVRPAAYDSSRTCGAARVLGALAEAAGGGPAGGAQLALRLGIGAEEVRRCVAELRALGYEVRDSGPDGRGGRRYRLAQKAAPLALPWEVIGGGAAAGRLAARRLGSRVVFYGSTDSTQARALDMIASAGGAGGSDGLVVVAGAQTAGRGRLGRRWVSPAGGLWMSVVAEPGPPACAATQLPLAAGLALAGAVEDATGVRADLKWPNDLLAGGRKVAGILVDAATGAGKGAIETVVVGVGVNLAVDAAAIDACAGAPRGHAGAASLAALGGGAGAGDPALLARAFLERLETELCGLGDAKEGVARRWEARSSMIGGAVEVQHGGRTVRGVAAGVDADGALLVRQGRKTARIVAGEVAVRPA